MSAENKALTRRIFEEVFSEGKLALIEQVAASDYSAHDPTSPPVQGHEGFRQFVTVYRTAFPDLRVKVEDQIADGDRVATRWLASGTHTGPLASPGGDIPPTGKRSNVTGITISRIAGGKVVEEWHNWDTLGMMQQLGLAPAPGQ